MVLVKSASLLAALVATRPDPDAKPKEIQACRERTRKRVKRLEKGKVGSCVDPTLAPDAAMILRFACVTCALCPGVTASTASKRTQEKLRGSPLEQTCRRTVQAEAVNAARSQQTEVASRTIAKLLDNCNACRRCVGL